MGEHEMTAQAEIDINCDAGESFGPWQMGDDEALMPLVTSVSIACGAHAGDPLVMQRTLTLAEKYGVSVGAHPSYPDMQGFGRRKMELSPDEVYAWVLAQIGALAAMARGSGQRLRHVKPHGALYNAAADFEALAQAIARAVRAFDPELVLVARAGSVQVRAGRALGLRVAEEAFADRGYDALGRLLPRGVRGAVGIGPETAGERAVDLVRTGSLAAADGSLLTLHPQTICIHSDTPGAAAIAGSVRAALEGAGVRLRPLHELAN